MTKSVRVRFAPSPTGPLHIGGLRTALFNYLFAKQKGGKFVLRIEDTDKNRYVQGSEQHIIDSLSWCGLEPDESPFNPGEFGPYRQSERKDLYKKAISVLIEKGGAYYAFDTKEELELLRNGEEKKGRVFSYNSKNRHKLTNSISLAKKEVDKKIANGEEFVVRFKTPENKTIVCEDILRGVVSVDSETLDDKILYKSDGMPTYHFANVVDDHHMKISHVIRGEEWLPSLPLHSMIYDSFGWLDKPSFVHLPLILKPVGKGKLSKRDGDKFGFPIYATSWSGIVKTKGYKEFGFLPQAVVNFLSLLGWNPGTEKEIFSLSELIQAFSFSGLNKSGARFDPEKNRWFNHSHIQNTKNSLVSDSIKKAFGSEHSKYKEEELDKIAELIKPRLEDLNDIFNTSRFFFIRPKEYPEKQVKKLKKTGFNEVIESLVSIIEKSGDLNNLKPLVEALVKEKEWGFGKVLGLFRLSIVGELSGPDLFEVVSIIGKQEVLERLHALKDHLNKVNL